MLDLHGHLFALAVHDERFCCEGPSLQNACSATPVYDRVVGSVRPIVLKYGIGRSLEDYTGGMPSAL
jgi:hypothetical protein